MNNLIKKTSLLISALAVSGCAAFVGDVVAAHATQAVAGGYVSIVPTPQSQIRQHVNQSMRQYHNHSQEQIRWRIREKIVNTTGDEPK